MKTTTKVAIAAVGATLGGLWLLGRYATPRPSAVTSGANRVFQAAGVTGVTSTFGPLPYRY